MRSKQTPGKLRRISPILLLIFVWLAEHVLYGAVREKNIVAAIDPVTEQRLGRVWMEQELLQYKITKNQAYIDLVNSIAQKILDAINDRPDLEDWQFTVVDVPQENAFAFPGGSIVVYSGMLDFLKDDQGKVDEEMLASVIGHEIAHVVQRHSLHSIRDEASLEWVLENLDAIEEKGKSSRLSNEEIDKFSAIARSRFTRVQEFEADQLGAFYAALAGYGYSGGIRYSQRIREKRGERQMLEYLEPAEKGARFRPLDHPTESERIAAMSEFQKFLRNIAGEFNLGYQLLQNGNYDKAINCFKDVVKVFPKSFQSWNNLGKAYHMKYLVQGSGPQEKPTPREKFQCELTDYFVNLRGQMRGAGELSKAVQYYTEAMRINPFEPGIKSNLAIALAQTREAQDLNRAEELLRGLISVHPDNKVYLNHLAVVLYMRQEGKTASEKNLAEVETLLQKAASQSYLPAQYNLAVFQLENGKEENGIAALVEYLKHDESGPWARAARGMLQQHKISPPEAKTKKPETSSVLNVRLGVTRDELLRILGEPDRTESATTSQEDSGQILWYETSGASFVISEGRVVAAHLFKPQISHAGMLQAVESAKEPLPEIGGIAIGADAQQLVLALGEPVQVIENEERAEKIYSYGNEDSRIDFRIQVSKVRVITIRKL